MDISTAEEVQSATISPDILGESPIWDHRVGRLLWVDVRAPALRSFDPDSGATERWPLPEIVSSVMLRASGGLVVGLKTGLHAFDPATGALALLCPIGEPHEGNRVNDCKVDRAGAIWWSTMWDFGARDDRLPLPASTRTARTRRSARASPSPTACASLPTAVGATSPTPRRSAWSASRSTRTGRWAAGATSGRRPACRAAPTAAPATRRGAVWNARYGGGAVVRLSPEGEVLGRIDLPVSQPSCCAFGGPNLRTLFITTSRQKLPDAALAREPLAGAVLRVEPGMAGLPEPEYAG